MAKGMWGTSRMSNKGGIAALGDRVASVIVTGDVGQLEGVH
jgi:hypothetical protein